MFLKVLRADLHGSQIMVLNSRVANQRGVSGIVLRETQNTLQIIDEEDRLIRLVKGNLVLLVPVGEKTMKIFGESIRIRPSMRVKHKFKLKKRSQSFLLENVKI